MLWLMVSTHLDKQLLTIGYEMAIFNSTDYGTYSPNERPWVKLAALRDAMAQYPHAEWFWYLDQVKP